MNAFTNFSLRCLVLMLALLASFTRPFSQHIESKDADSEPAVKVKPTELPPPVVTPTPLYPPLNDPRLPLYKMKITKLCADKNTAADKELSKKIQNSKTVDEVNQVTRKSCEKIGSFIDKCSHRRGSPGILEYLDMTPFITDETDACRGEVFLLAAVHSTPSHGERRTSIRSTWGSVRQVGPYRIKVMFFLGRAKSAAEQASVDLESKRYRDIIQRDYDEAYRNITRKHLTIMEWISDHCSSARFLLKSDDDTFVDIFHAVQFLVTTPLSRSFYCTATNNAKPARKRSGYHSKWYVTREEFSGNRYPKYCEGLGYMMDARLTHDLHYCSFYSKFFWIDDVYVGGILPHKLRAPLYGFWAGHAYAALLPSHASPRILDFIFLTATHNEFMPTLWRKLWKSVLIHSMELNMPS